MKKTAVRIKANPVTITPEQVQFFDENGYVVIPGVFEPTDCEEIIRAAEEHAAEDFAVYLNIHRDVPLFLEIVRDPVLVNMIKAVQRSKIVGLNDQFLYKKPGTTYAKQSWQPHQDNAYPKAPRGAYMQLHISLVASDRENGCLYAYPGSQREELLPYEYVQSWREKPDADGITRPGWRVQVPPQYECVDVTAPQGAVTMQHGHLIHGSHPNLTRDRARSQYSIAYINEGVPFEQGKGSKKIPIAVE